MAVTQQEIENRLWEAADELRVAMPEAQYSSVVFPLMFWKYLSDTWEHHHQEFLADNENLDGLSACRLTVPVFPFGDGQVSFGDFADVGAGCSVVVLGASGSSGAGCAGFWCAGGMTGFRT